MDSPYDPEAEAHGSSCGIDWSNWKLAEKKIADLEQLLTDQSRQIEERDALVARLREILADILALNSVVSGDMAKIQVWSDILPYDRASTRHVYGDKTPWCEALMDCADTTRPRRKAQEED